MASLSKNRPLSEFIQYLIKDGVLSESESEIHNAQAQKKQTPLLNYLVVPTNQCRLFFINELPE